MMREATFIGSVFRGLFLGVAFIVGLSGGCWAIDAILPARDVPQVSPKLAQFARHRDDYDTLLIGSSRIYYQIIPALFDRLNAEAGFPTRTFNAGISGMRPPEDGYFLDQILSSQPRHLRWVLIELAGLRTNVDPVRAETIRGVYWHDWRRMMLLFERALYQKPDAKKRKWQRTLWNRIEPFGDFFRHVPPFFRNQTNLGRVSDLSWILLSPSPPRPVTAEAVMGADLAGWIPTGRPEIMSGKDLANYDEGLEERRREKAVGEVADSVSQKALEIMIAKIEKIGATPVLIVPPTTNRRNFIPSPERAEKTIVLDFCDLEKYPELFERRYRLDTDHLNTAGAEVFTRIFVGKWAEERERRK
jgi:hypothetical protein